MVINPTELGATTFVAPVLMLDHFLPIPNAESLLFYPPVLRLVVREGSPQADSLPAGQLGGPTAQLQPTCCCRLPPGSLNLQDTSMQSLKVNQSQRILPGLKVILISVAAARPASWPRMIQSPTHYTSQHLPEKQDL